MATASIKKSEALELLKFCRENDCKEIMLVKVDLLPSLKGGDSNFTENCPFAPKCKQD